MISFFHVSLTWTFLWFSLQALFYVNQRPSKVLLNCSIVSSDFDLGDLFSSPRYGSLLNYLDGVKMIDRFRTKSDEQNTTTKFAHKLSHPEVNVKYELFVFSETEGYHFQCWTSKERNSSLRITYKNPKAKGSTEPEPATGNCSHLEAIFHTRKL